MPAEIRLYNTLVARGFLLDNNGGFYLSDNSYIPQNPTIGIRDDEFLDESLRDQKIGYVNSLRVHINGEISNKQLSHLFLIAGGCESIGFRFSEEWDYFKRREHGMKTPLALLEPFVGRLVKAISATGMFMKCSCDGHGKNRIIIEFASRYDIAWFRILLDLLKTRGISLICNWIFRPQGLIGSDLKIRISHPYQNILLLYQEVQLVANWLYTNRIALRDLKKSLLSGINKKEVFEMDFPDLRQFYRELLQKHQLL